MTPGEDKNYGSQKHTKCTQTGLDTINTHALTIKKTLEVQWKGKTYSTTGKFVNPLEFSIFLHKYDPKHNQIFAKVLKENPIKQMTLKYFLVIYLFSVQCQKYVNLLD